MDPNAPPPPPGWYTDPYSPSGQRWWDGVQWTEHTGPPPQPAGRVPVSGDFPWRPILAVLAVLIAFAYFVGGLDEPLSSVGLNKETCAENFAGNTMCGDDLVQFCRENYDKDINADACDEALSDAGEDPQSISDDQEQSERDYERCLDDAAKSSDPSAMGDCTPP